MNITIDLWQNIDYKGAFTNCSVDLNINRYGR